MLQKFKEYHPHNTIIPILSYKNHSLLLSAKAVITMMSSHSEASHKKPPTSPHNIFASHTQYKQIIDIHILS